MFSSKTDQWATPQAFFDELNREFHFTLDVAADATNHKCPAYYDKAVDGLKQPWVTSGGVFCNPPYGRGIGQWVKKAYEESLRGATVVMLMDVLTSSTSTFFRHTPLTR
jgi:site-specific DNA-methyltransferase (adenine-specific)